MKTKLTSLIIASAFLAGASFNTSAAMDPYLEKSLIDVCKAVKSNKLIKYSTTMRSYRFRDKMIVDRLMCNGDNVIAFAEKHNAFKTAARLKRRVGKVTITDIAALDKWSVNF
ncbi:DUF3718 domain-containing protein [Thalassotalea fusca]